jgi:hypothetical protein
MALREMKTLGEMGAEVLDRCGMPAALSDDQLPQVYAFLREAQAWLWVKFANLRQRIMVDIPVIAGVSTYDIPDQFDAGSIEQLEAVDEDGVRWRLDAGIRPEDRSAYALSAALTSFEPCRYDIHDGDIEVLGVPGATIERLVVTGIAAQATLLEEGHRPTVDDEAMVRYAVAKLKSFKKQISGQEYQVELAALADYVGDLDGSQGTGSSFLMGGEWTDPSEMPSSHRRDRPWWLANRRP